MDANRRVSAQEAAPRKSGAEMLAEHFVPDHVFVYVTSGEVRAYDGTRRYVLTPGEYCLVQKNRLVSYDKGASTSQQTIVCFEEAFLRSFQAKHQLKGSDFRVADTFVRLATSNLVPEFVHSLQPYYTSAGKLDAAFAGVKYEELLLILLRQQPELAGILFEYGTPGKVDLEAFMTKNYKFNVSIPRFAFLTGRSLSAFKRDFQALFHQTPSRWLVQRRLQEAYFLIHTQGRHAAEIYLELGFEDLSHFSFAFKKRFNCTPTALAAGALVTEPGVAGGPCRSI